MHRQVVVFVTPTMTRSKLAGYLRDAADRLDPPTPSPNEALAVATVRERDA